MSLICEFGFVGLVLWVAGLRSHLWIHRTSRGKGNISYIREDVTVL